MTVSYHQNPLDPHRCPLTPQEPGRIARCECGRWWEATVNGWRILPKDSLIITTIQQQES